MESELKPCPNPWCESFDRGDEFTPYVTRIHFDNWQVKCPMCFMNGPVRQTPTEAIAAWNQRPTPPADKPAQSGEVSDEMVEAAAKAHCDFFGGEGWWDTGLIADTKPKALEAMRAALEASTLTERLRVAEEVLRECERKHDEPETILFIARAALERKD